MPIKINGQTYYRTAEICQLAGVSRSTLLRWFSAGTVADVACRDRRDWRLFSAGDLKRIKHEAGRIREDSPLPANSGIYRK